MVATVRSMWLAVAVACCLPFRASSAAARPLVLRNGTIYTLVPEAPYASAICVHEGRIAAVGDDHAVLHSDCASQVQLPEIVDLQGATVVPGLTDSHAHLMMEAARRTRADLSSARSAADAARLALDFAHKRMDLVNASGGWVQGFGWDQTKWPGSAFPTRQDLDKLFPETPVFLEQLSGHACWINGKALELMAADIPAAGDPAGGHVERDANGQPTGVLSDRAVDLVRKRIPALPEPKADAVLGEVLADCAAHGLTGLHDMMAERADVELFQKRQAEGRLGLRVYAMRDGEQSSPSDPHVATEDGLLTVRGVKFFADGALGSWSAAMLRPYDDRPNVTGTLRYSKEELQGNVSAWAARGYQVATHAIGDAANRQVLDVYEALRPEGRRWRVEHAQILAEEEIGRFARLGVLPSMQPSHCASDLPYAEQRLGRDRASRGYAWMALLRTGVQALPFGSDFPTAGSVPPLLGLHAAVTRETPEGEPRGGWFPAQRVTAMQALKGYTVDAAFASFRERELGTIAPGFYADLSIFDLDVLTADAPKILNATVLSTIVGGRVTHAAPAAPAGLAALVRREGASPAWGGPKQRPPQPSASRQLERWWRRFKAELRDDRWRGVPSRPRAADLQLVI